MLAFQKQYETFLIKGLVCAQVKMMVTLKCIEPLLFCWWSHDMVMSAHPD